MNASLRHRRVGSRLVFALAFFGSSASLADSVQFQRGEVAPPLAITPSSPITTNVIGFTTPLDGNVHSNACEAAAALGGDPTLVIDDANHIIDLLYDGNVPMACPRIFDPTIGAEGEFGPLAAGDWIFSDPHNNTFEFTVIPEPSSSLLVLTGALALLTRRRERLVTSRTIR